MDLFGPMPGREVWITLGGAVASILGVLTLRFVWDAVRVGPRAAARRSFHLDEGAWRLLALLIFFAIAGMTVWFQWV